jgi:hypothetical protein
MAVEGGQWGSLYSCFNLSRLLYILLVGWEFWPAYLTQVTTLPPSAIVDSGRWGFLFPHSDCSVLRR